MIRLLLGIFFAALPVWADSPWEPRSFGILLLAHGGGSQWNDEVLQARKALSAKYPTEVAFGMADPIEIQRAVDHLSSQHIKKIIAIPLFISSHSEVMDQTKYVLGIRQDPSKDFINAPHSHMMKVVVKRIQTSLPIVLAPALDDHPIVAQILLDRAREMSRDPGKESVILVGHGPLKDDDNALWLKTMDKLAAEVQKQGGFAAVRTATLRDDAPDLVKRKADLELRILVQTLSLRSRVLVVPHLIAQGGIERHIRAALDGTFYDWKGRTLLPDPRITQWLEESAQKSADLSDMRQFKDEGRSLRSPGSHTFTPADAVTMPNHAP